jgi:DNA-binding CsgD family transcriptional regulator
VGSDWVDLFFRSFCLAISVPFAVLLIIALIVSLRRQKSHDAPSRPATAPAPQTRAFDFLSTLPSFEYEAYWKTLTGREKEIARLVAQGKRNETIARELFLSNRTVGNHLQSIYRKMNINSRGELKHIVPKLRDP